MKQSKKFNTSRALRSARTFDQCWQIYESAPGGSCSEVAQKALARALKFATTVGQCKEVYRAHPSFTPEATAALHKMDKIIGSRNVVRF